LLIIPNSVKRLSVVRLSNLLFFFVPFVFLIIIDTFLKMAFDNSSKQNKTFHIDRIAYVDFAGKPFKNSKKFEKQIPDVFGFSHSGKAYPIQLELDLKQVPFFD